MPRFHSQQLTGDRGTQPEMMRWRRDLELQLQRDIQLLNRRESRAQPSAALKARVRMAMLKHLTSHAPTDHQATREPRVAWWFRHLGEIDAWIDQVDAKVAASAILSMELASPESPLLGGREIAEALRQLDPSPLERLSEEAVALLLCAGARRDVCQSVRHAFATMQEMGGDPLPILELIATIRIASTAMAIPAWQGTMHLRTAVRVLDQRIVKALAQLEKQAEWLVVCGDPWLHPAAYTAISHIRNVSAQRGVLVRCSWPEVWESDDGEMKTQLMAAAHKVEAGEDDNTMHDALLILADRYSVPPRLNQTLEMLGWPADPLDRLLWNPGQGGQLFHAMEAIRYSAINGDQAAWQRQWQLVNSLVGTEPRSEEPAE